MATISYESYYGASQLCEPYLMHHGTKGMKWYHRRYQNEDGSLTALGRIHYGIGKGRKEEGAKELVDAYDAKKKEEKAARKAEREEANKQKILTSGTAAKLLANSDKFTNQEIQQAIQRIELKKKLSTMSLPEKTLIQTINDKLSSYGTLANTAANFKKALDNVADAFEDKEEKKAREAREASAKNLYEAIEQVKKKDITDKLAAVIKKTREETNGSEADVERAVKLATDKFLKNVEDAKNGKKKEDYDSFMKKLNKKNAKDQKETDSDDRLQKLNEEYGKLNDEAKETKSSKESKASNESFINKLSQVEDQFEADRKGPRDSQDAWDHLKQTLNEAENSRTSKSAKEEARSSNESFISKLSDVASTYEKERHDAYVSNPETYKNLKDLGVQTKLSTPVKSISAIKSVYNTAVSLQNRAHGNLNDSSAATKEIKSFISNVENSGISSAVNKGSTESGSYTIPAKASMSTGRSIAERLMSSVTSSSKKPSAPSIDQGKDIVSSNKSLLERSISFLDDLNKK